MYDNSFIIKEYIDLIYGFFIYDKVDIVGSGERKDLKK